MADLPIELDRLLLGGIGGGPFELITIYYLLPDASGCIDSRLLEASEHLKILNLISTQPIPPWAIGAYLGCCIRVTGERYPPEKIHTKGVRIGHIK